MTARPTWPVDCDMPMLEMLSFCTHTMAGMIQEDIDRGGGCGCGAKKLTVPQLRADLKTANRIMAALAKAEINLAVQSEVAKTRKRGGKR